MRESNASAWVIYGFCIGSMHSEMRNAACRTTVFSLVELAEKGLQIPVDYGMSLIELAVHIFRVTKQGLCPCKALLVNYVLQINPAAFVQTSSCFTVEWQFSRRVERLVRACPDYHRATALSWNKWHPNFIPR